MRVCYTHALFHVTLDGLRERTAIASAQGPYFLVIVPTGN